MLFAALIVGSSILFYRRPEYNPSHAAASIPDAILPSKTPSASGTPKPAGAGSFPVIQVEQGPDRAASISSFESSSNIWEFASKALTSKNSSYLYEAYTGARECLGFVGIGQKINSFISGSTTENIRGPVTPERQLAAARLNEKCSDFVKRGAAESKGLVESLKKQGESINGVEFAIKFATTKDREEALSHLLYSASPAAHEAALPLLVARLSSQNEDGVAKDDPVAGVAAMLALCDLGKDCSANSFSASLRCALSGACYSTLWEDWSSGLTNEQAEQVQAMRKKIVEAVNRRNLEKKFPGSTSFEPH